MTIEFLDARRVAHRLGHDHRLDPETVPLAVAHRRTLAAPIRARTAVPAVDTSAMDGWAVAGNGPWTLDGTVRMGVAPERPLAAGHALGITTGGAVPVGTTAVLRTERGRAEGQMVTACPDAPVLPAGADIRPAGEDVTCGGVVAAAGTRATPAVIAAAAVAGADQVEVVRRPRVALVLLGDEVVDHGVPAPGQVRDAFGVSLPGIVQDLGMTVSNIAHVPDDRDAVEHALRDADADLIVSTGGTGRGRCDHLVPALDELGAVVVARGIAMRPGHPTVLARRGDGVPVLGLPGNPFAAMLALITVGLPLCAGIVGSPAPAVLRRRTGRPLAGHPTGTRLVAVSDTPDGVVPVPHQGPAMVGGLVGADAIAVVPSAGVGVGGRVDVLALPWCR